MTNFASPEGHWILVVYDSTSTVRVRYRARTVRFLTRDEGHRIRTVRVRPQYEYQPSWYQPCRLGRAASAP